MAGLGSIVRYKLHSRDTAPENWGTALGAAEGDYLPALVTSEPTGSPAVANLQVVGNSTACVAFFLEAMEQGDANGEWSELP